jgi:glycyl-tRNA synthetase beta chain
LLQRVRALESRIAPLLAEQNYEDVLKTLAELRSDVDAFFERVMVMAEEPEVRSNRLGLLRAIEALFLTVADISLLK